MARLHKANTFVVPVVRYLRRTVENLSNAVPSVATNYRKTLSLYYIRNYVAHLSVHCVWFAVFYRFHQSLISGFD